MIEQTLTAYNEAVFDTDRDKALSVVEEAILKGVLPEDIVFKVVIPSMEYMMKSLSENFDTNLAQHFMTAQIASEVTEKMVVQFKQTPMTTGCVVIGTSEGDLHSLGKRIVIGCLKSLMMDVTDIGVNVPPEKFVDEALIHHAHVIDISSMMVHTARGEHGCLRVREILKERKLEETIKIVVGGAPYRFDHDLYKDVQADAWAENGITAGQVIAELVKEVRHD